MSVFSTVRDAAKVTKQGETAIGERQRARLARAVASARSDSPFYRELYRDVPQHAPVPLHRSERLLMSEAR